LEALFEQNANELFEIHENALDYTTAEGKHRQHTVADYLITVRSIIENSPHFSGIPDIYQGMAYRLERAREMAHMKDQKKAIEYHTEFFRFSPDISNNDQSNSKKSRRKNKTADSFNLSKFYTLPLEPFFTKDANAQDESSEENGQIEQLPWRGQFIPFEVNPVTLGSSPHPLAECFLEVVPIPGSKFKEGLFLATYRHPRISGESCNDVFFIPCSENDGAKQVFYQCLIDELKPIFGIPALGTHCLYLDHCFEKLNKKAEWSAQNFEITSGRGSHVVMFPVTAFGFKNREAVLAALSTTVQDDTNAAELQQGGGLSNFTVDALTISPLRKTRVPFLTTDFDNIRYQVINIFMFYICLGVSKGALSKMFLVPPEESPINLQQSGDEQKDDVNLEKLFVAAKAKVVPFYELKAFTNLPFPEIIKKVRQTVLRALWIGDQDYVMLRFFNLMTHLNWDGIETVLQRFRAPVFEWAGVIRTNLHDLRAGWLVWSQYSEANQLVQRQKNHEKNRARLQRKRAAKQGDDYPAQESKSEETGFLKTSETSKPPTVKRVKTKKRPENPERQEPDQAQPSLKKKSKVSSTPSGRTGTGVVITKKTKNPPKTPE
jgi:hypothetical protein